MTQTPARDWLLPRLLDLVKQAQAAGISRTVAVAVITDLIGAPEFNPPDDAVAGQ